MSTFKVEEQPKIRMIRFNVSTFNLIVKEDGWGNKNVADNSEVSVNFTPKTRKEENVLDIIFNVTLKSEDTIFYLNASFIATFETHGIEINNEYLNNPLIKSNAPAMVFPFIRAYISNIMQNSGYYPIILPSFNFSEVKEIQ